MTFLYVFALIFRRKTQVWFHNSAQKTYKIHFNPLQRHPFRIQFDSQQTALPAQRLSSQIRYGRRGLQHGHRSHLCRYTIRSLHRRRPSIFLPVSVNTIPPVYTIRSKKLDPHPSQRLLLPTAILLHCGNSLLCLCNICQIFERAVGGVHSPAPGIYLVGK